MILKANLPFALKNRPPRNFSLTPKTKPISISKRQVARCRYLRNPRPPAALREKQNSPLLMNGTQIMTKRIKRLELQLTVEEFNSLQNAARARKMKTATFLRVSHFRKIPPVVPQINISALRQLSGIGNNINQIAHNSNISGFINIRELQQEIANLRLLLISPQITQNGDLSK